RMTLSRPYAIEIRRVIGHLANAHPEYRHSYLEERPVKQVGLIVVTTDRGLCGGLNANLLKTTVQEMMSWDEKQVPVELCLIGNKAQAFFKRIILGQLSPQSTLPVL